MGYTPLNRYTQEAEQPLRTRPRTAWWLHLGLFILTFMSTIMAGTSWAMHDFQEVANWGYGLQYGVLIMMFLSAHEFGHYFAARYHGVDASLPYFIPVPPIFQVPFGTMGAVMSTRSPITTRKALFDIGIAGPLAGFVMCVAFLIVGIATMPPRESIYLFHPEYRLFSGSVPEYGLYFGNSILYSFLTTVIPNPHGFLPPLNEMYHYPFLCVGWFGLFITALNLLPAGQLDGGHIMYAMFGDLQHKIGRWAWRILLLLGMGSVLGWLHLQIMYDSPDALYTFFQKMLIMPLNFLHIIAPWYYNAWSGWLFWAFLLRFAFRIQHPPMDEDEEPLGTGRIVLGWLAVLIFITSFSFNGIFLIQQTEQNAIPGAKRKGNAVQVTPSKPAVNVVKTSSMLNEKLR